MSLILSGVLQVQAAVVAVTVEVGGGAHLTELRQHLCYAKKHIHHQLFLIQPKEAQSLLVLTYWEMNGEFFIAPVMAAQSQGAFISQRNHADATFVYLTAVSVNGCLSNCAVTLNSNLIWCLEY